MYVSIYVCKYYHDDGVVVDQVTNKVSQTQPAKAPPVAAVVTPTIIEEDLFVSSLSIDEKVGGGYSSLYRKTTQLFTISCRDLLIQYNIVTYATALHLGCYSSQCRRRDSNDRGATRPVYS